MAQRRNSKAKTFQFGTVNLNEVLNPNLQFQSLYSQNLFEEHKVIVDNLWSLKPQNFQNKNLEYAYGKTISALAQHLQNLQNQFVVLETEKFQMLKNQEKQEKCIKELESESEPLNNVSKTDLISMIKKSALLFEQFEKLSVKNKFGPDIYNIIEYYYLDKYYEKVFKNQCILYEQFRTNNSGIKTGYMAYHDPDLFFVVYLAYVNMTLLDQKYFELIPELMSQGILKNIFLTSFYQIPNNFPEKLKNIVQYLFRTETHVDISFETIPPLFRTDGSIVPAYHHVYIKHNKEPLIPQQQPEWEMTRSKEFPSFYNRFRDFQIFEFRKTRNKNFYLIGETPTMSIWRTQPIEKIFNPKIFITSEEQDFINQLWADSPELSYVSDDANFWESLDAESFANVENTMEG